MRSILFTLLGLFALTAVADPRQPVELPAKMREHTLANMHDYLTTLAEIQSALGAGKSEQAADVAEQRIGMSSLERHGASHMAPYMPMAMPEIGTNMHRTASRFARTAQEVALAKEPARAIGALAEVTQQCVACHASFRLK